MQHNKKEAMLRALENSLGVVTTACKSVNINRTTHYRWIKEDAKYAEAVREIEEVAIDFAESNLHKQIQEGNTSATIFYLKTKGKRRGYIERQEVEQVGETKVVVQPLSDTAQEAIERILS